MKKTQTIVDRERIGSDYIESKQDFSTVLSQVKQLSTTTWTNPWFYGPIGIAVFAVTVSIVSLNPSSATEAVVQSEYQDKEMTNSPEKVEAKVKDTEVTPELVMIETMPEKTNNVVAKNDPVEIPEKAPVEKMEALAVISEVEKTPVIKRKIPLNNRYPHIEGVYTGEISLNDLFAESGIQVNPTVKIISFDLNFYDGKSNVVRQIDGNVVPVELYDIIEKHNLAKMLFITNIKAIDEYDRIFTLPSINYKPMLTE